MLCIRDEQMEVLRDVAEQRFRQWLLVHVRKHWPVPVARIGDEQLGGFIDAAIARALEFGIEDSASVTRYVNLVMQLGPGFPDDSRIPWAGDLLRSAGLGEEQKVRAVKQMLRNVDPGSLDPAGLLR